MTKKIYFAIPNRESSAEVNAELTQTVSMMSDQPDECLPDLDGGKVKISFSYMQPVDANRNKMVKEFLEDPDAEWLYMNDSDVVPPEDVLKMAEHGKKVVSATVCIKKKRVPQPVILKDEGGSYRQTSVGEYQDEIRGDGLLEVDGVGTGCLMVHRSVLEEMEPPWFRFEYNAWGGLELGEDFYFSRRVKQNGHSIYVDTDKVCKHYRTVDLTEYAMSVIDAKNGARQELAQRLQEADDVEAAAQEIITQYGGGDA